MNRWCDKSVNRTRAVWSVFSVFLRATDLFAVMFNRNYAERDAAELSTVLSTEDARWSIWLFVFQNYS